VRVLCLISILSSLVKVANLRYLLGIRTKRVIIACSIIATDYIYIYTTCFCVCFVELGQGRIIAIHSWVCVCVCVCVCVFNFYFVEFGEGCEPCVISLVFVPSV